MNQNKIISKHLLFIILIGIMLMNFACSSGQRQASEDLVKYVDPMIGTAGHGHTFPGATTPFGMIQLSPSNDNRAWDWCSGYHYSDSVLKGFAHNHVSGGGLGAFGDFLLMPTSGELKLSPGSDANPDDGYRSRFSHDTEKPHAGYYTVHLDDYDIKVELTATPRVGFHRYTFNNSGENHIIIDPTHSVREGVRITEIEILSDIELRGSKTSNGAAGPRTVYFYAQFSKPFDKSGIAIDNSIANNKAKASKKNALAFVSYNLSSGDQVEVKLALSYVSYAGAKMNFDAEAKNTNFDSALKNAEELWLEKLSKFEIKGTEKQKRIFYTGIYHSQIAPNLISDVDGNYVVEQKQLHSDITQYSNYSTWDTYRATHPLLTLVEHEKTAEFVNSLASRWTEAKVSLPIWECGGFDNFCMIGRSPISVMGEAILKDIKGIDIESAYLAMRQAAFDQSKASPNYGKNDGMDSYLKRNYITVDVGNSVSKTTEYNYHDFVLAQVAKKLSKSEDYELFTKRSRGYRNLWNKEKMYLWPKTEDGDWVEMRINVWDDLDPHYVSGNIWAYSAYVPHEVDHLIEMVGGEDIFVKWLDKIFADTSAMIGKQHVDISGFIGKYGHGDEPSQHMPYLYSYANAPHRTQELVREICHTMYSDKPEGFINNEDLGQMSSWYLFSSMGFYPVSPGSKEYVIGSPLHDEVIIHLANGKMFKITAINNSKENKYVKSVSYNGKNLENYIITHDMIMNGGELLFEMKSTK